MVQTRDIRVTFQGVESPGKHEPLVDSQTWQTVQAILASRRYGERQRIHNHFLKSTVVCGQCGARLSVQNAKNSKGTIYPYFVCARRCRLHDCAFTAVLINVVEERMSDLYQAIQLSAADRMQIEHYLHDELAQIEGEKDKAVRSLTTRRTNIEDKRRRLLHAHYEGVVPLDLLKEEQAELSTELNQIERQLAAYQADAAEVRQHLTQALDLLEDCHRLYTAAPAQLKKLLNQVFFERVLVNPLVDEDGRVILLGDGTSDGANAGGPVDKDAAGEETGSEDSASLSADPDHDQVDRRDAGIHDEQQQHSAGEEETSDASRGGAAATDASALTPHPIHLATPAPALASAPCSPHPSTSWPAPACTPPPTRTTCSTRLSPTVQLQRPPLTTRP